MKKAILFFVFLVGGYTLYAQTINTLPATGNVGLGTSSPNTKLQVCGDVKIDSSLTVKSEVKAESDLKVDGDVYLGGDFYFTNGVPNAITPNKIALFEPNGQLRGGSIGLLVPILYEEECTNKFTDENGVVYAYPAPAWKSVPGPNNGFLYTGEHCPAKVGIGTSAPATELDVIGNIHSFTMGIGIIPTGNVSLDIKESSQLGVSTNILLRAQSISNTGELVFKNNGELKTHTNSNDYALTIYNENPSGQGIYITGGAGPNSLTNYGLINVEVGGKQIFYVDGKNSITYAREVKVNTNLIWPDYVFEENYERMNSEEKEKYFKEFKHLPGIASASEMEKDGIPVSSTLNGLTRNVEENSLDINLLFNEIQELKKENEKLRKEMEELKNK